MRIGMFSVVLSILIPFVSAVADEKPAHKVHTVIVVYRLHSVSAANAASAIEREFLKSGAVKRSQTAIVPKSPFTLIPDARTNTLFVIAPKSYAQRIYDRLESMELDKFNMGHNFGGAFCHPYGPLVETLNLSPVVNKWLLPPSVPEQRLEHLRILASFEKPVSWDYRKTPLEQVIRQIATDSDINVVLDEEGLKDAKLHTKSPVTNRARNVPLRSALGGLLNSHGLGYVIEDEVVMISSRQRLLGKPDLVVYPVADLVATVKDGKAVIDFGAIARKIKADVLPMSWKSSDCEVRRIEKKLCLAIVQTKAGHRAIATLLRTIRAERAKEYDLPVR